MEIRLLCFFLLMVNVTLAQVDFDSKKVIVETRGYAAKVTSLAYSDLDNDNQKDLIATSYYDNSIFWYKNVGGDFTYRSIIKITDNFYLPDQLCAKDLDNDGFNDVIATSQYGNTVVWFKNLGNATFSEALPIGNLNAPLPVISDDIDNDGDNDVIVGISDAAPFSDDSVVLYKNLGNGVFQSAELLYLGSSNINIVKLIDLNNDGLLDIVSGARDGTVQYAKNLGNATFSSPISIGSGGNDGKSFDFIDIDNDGFLDLISEAVFADYLVYYLNQSGNSFSESTTINTTLSNSVNFKVIDMNNDGRKDLLVSYDYGKKMGYYKRLANGNFSAIIAVTANLYNSSCFIAEDFDSNGYTDVAAPSYTEDSYGFTKLSVYNYKPAQTIYSEIIINFTTVPGLKISIADLNNDGFQDIISSNYALKWNENHGDGTYSASKLISSPSEISGSAMNDYEITDIDNDGDLDFVAITDSNFKVYKNLGNENFQLFFATPVLHNFREIEVADLDGDNLKDIIITDPEGGFNYMGWFRNTGGSFSTFNLIAFDQISFQPDQLNAGDIDNDGDQDLIVTSKSYQKVQWLENNGSAVFTFHELPFQATRMTELLTVDFDNDGDLDIFTSDDYFSGIYLYKNNSGVLASPLLLFNYPATSLVLSDLNNDGWKDLIASETNYITSVTKLVYYLNNGSTFGSQQVLDDALINESGHITAGDLNNDGKSDVAVARYWGEICYYTNLSTLAIIDIKESEDKLIFYPIPFLNIICWSDQESNKKEYSISIFSESGKKVLEIEKNVSNSVSLASLTAGVYFIQLKSKDQTITRKIVKK